MPLRDKISLHLRQAYLAMHRRAQAHFAQFGVTADQYVLLCLLADNGPMTQVALGEKAGSDANTITAMLGRLETKKLVLRKSHPEDGRARLVSLSRSGARFQKKLVASVEDLYARLDAAVPPRSRASFCHQLDDITRAMSADTALEKPRNKRNNTRRRAIG